MPRYIDADALLEDIIGITDGWRAPKKDWKWYEDCIKDAPTVDVAPIVQCKNCKHYSGVYDKDGYFTVVGYCHHKNHPIIPLRYDFYCADGVKKDEVN